MTSGASIEQHFPFDKHQIGKIAKLTENNGIRDEMLPGRTNCARFAPSAPGEHGAVSPCETAGSGPPDRSSLGPFGNACEFMRKTVHISRSADFLSIGLALEAGLTSLGHQRFARPGERYFRTKAKGT
ncbi:hypothetical protein [Rhizobium sp. PL01]|uniref:hypothetical protein n=1 Tax=Rhizobium sp. PL01 TaxID=3085631 RepID=UPI002980DED9|nr:hypothetical protein [Rhizobium sp. PL01]MDW5314341.1 hypothetical protein [Rhizobium sp. PL01]